MDRGTFSFRKWITAYVLYAGLRRPIDRHRKLESPGELMFENQPRILILELLWLHNNFMQTDYDKNGAKLSHESRKQHFSYAFGR